ncbi:MAG TPA: DUF167 domain-containing protein [bacterium]|nr:DUF167 domain-containing protein [bacterium]
MPLKVKPRSQAIRVGVGEGCLEVEVTAPPVEGAANTAVVAAVADALGLRKRQVSILSGGAGRQKVVLVEGITLDELQRRIEGLP